MKKIASSNIATILILVSLSYLVYYLLLQENCFHASISSIINNSHQLEAKKRLLVLGLLPCYIALMIFGTGILGVYLGSRFQRCLRKKIKMSAHSPSSSSSLKKYSIISVRK